MAPQVIEQLPLRVQLRDDATFENFYSSEAQEFASQIQLSAGGDRNAAKILLDKGWDRRKAGAPTKVEREGELKKQAKIVSIVDDDLKRLGL